MTRKFSIIYLAGALALVAGAAGCDDPGEADRTSLFRWQYDDAPSSGERGAILISEINFAGSVRDDGTHFGDDIFVELQNKHPRPVNISGWHLIVRGDVSRSYRIPDVKEPILPNAYFVIARKKDGAFGEAADLIIEDLELGTHRVALELRDYDLRLMEDAGSREDEVFAGGYDTVSVRSMERVELIFGNTGSSSRNWHAYSEPAGFPTVADGWRKFTLASPGAANSADYSGAVTTGSFE